jgi:alpha(1,3/1,4) fucosyltransferase
MKNIKIDFRNFWKLDYQNDVTLKFIKHFFEINNASIDIDNQNPDIIFYSVFGNANMNNKSIKVLFTRENLYDHWYPKTHLPNLDKFDFVLGFEDNIKKNHYKIPYYFVVGKLYDQSQIDYQIISKNLVENLYKKSKNISLISRNPHELRLSLINKFKNKDIVVDCPGKVGNNIKILNIENGELFKINFLSDYFFNICPENSWYPGYTTEKLYHAMISGCIPIYWGCDKLDDGFYNKEKVFFINKDLSNLDSTVDDTVKLLNNPNELLHHVGMNPFGENRLNIISDQNKKIKNIFKQIIDSL